MMVSAFNMKFLWTQPSKTRNESSAQFPDSVWQIELGEYALSGGVVFDLFMFIFATILLSKPSEQQFSAFTAYSQDDLSVFNVLQQNW